MSVLSAKLERRYAIIAKLWNDPEMTPRDIAQILDVVPETVIATARKMGFESRAAACRPGEKLKKCHPPHLRAAR